MTGPSRPPWAPSRSTRTRCADAAGRPARSRGPRRLPLEASASTCATCPDQLLGNPPDPDDVRSSAPRFELDLDRRDPVRVQAAGSTWTEKCCSPRCSVRRPGVRGRRTASGRHVGPSSAAGTFRSSSRTSCASAHTLVARRAGGRLGPPGPRSRIGAALHTLMIGRRLLGVEADVHALVREPSVRLPSPLRLSYQSTGRLSSERGHVQVDVAVCTLSGRVDDARTVSPVTGSRSVGHQFSLVTWW